MASQPSGPNDVELQQATGLLKDALAEACGARIEQADTGQLVRVEQALALAADAAKQAVSIRRRARRDARGQATAPAPAVRAQDVHADMGTHRVFVDAAGVTWDAFAVHPSAETSSKARLPEPYQRGWLSFDSGAERRRLSPIPQDWLTVPEYALRELCRRADPAPRRSSLPRSSGPMEKRDPS